MKGRMVIAWMVSKIDEEGEDANGKADTTN
jgi:hypothetical protein